MWGGNPPDVEYYQTKKYLPEELTHIQLYETTSEGTPKSPVFKADELEILCEYAAENCTTFASFKATKEEWFEALKEEAKRRGFLTKGTKFKSTFDDNGMIRVVDNFKGCYTYHDLNLDYIHGLRYNDGLDNKNGGCSNPCIYRDGVWAEVIKEEIPTQEEIDRVLDYLKNKNNS